MERRRGDEIREEGGEERREEEVGGEERRGEEKKNQKIIPVCQRQPVKTGIPLARMCISFIFLKLCRDVIGITPIIPKL